MFVCGRAGGGVWVGRVFEGGVELVMVRWRCGGVVGVVTSNYLRY